MWCSGKVIDLDPRPYTTFPKGKSATVQWDANPRLMPPEPVTTSGCKLLPTLSGTKIVLGPGAWT